MDLDPRKEIEVDPDSDLDPERGLKWIRIRPNAVDPGGSGSETLQRTLLTKKQFGVTEFLLRSGIQAGFELKNLSTRSHLDKIVQGR